MDKIKQVSRRTCERDSDGRCLELDLTARSCLLAVCLGRTALYVAVERRDPSLSTIELLLKAGANPNKTDISLTPMAVFPLCRQAKKVSERVKQASTRSGRRPHV